MHTRPPSAFSIHSPPLCSQAAFAAHAIAIWAVVSGLPQMQGSGFAFPQSSASPGPGPCARPAVSVESVAQPTRPSTPRATSSSLSRSCQDG
jgi:hypothetical protein